ncbi:hypothetical protein [Streptomyces sp. NPDC092307]|uniref:hypothetical protein n=1 Tax=Streptomyces sp. NPDC092307 TaxID=3366013 RepID=UPI00380BC70D
MTTDLPHADRGDSGDSGDSGGRGDRGVIVALDTAGPNGRGGGLRRVIASPREVGALRGLLGPDRWPRCGGCGRPPADSCG